MQELYLMLLLKKAKMWIGDCILNTVLFIY